MITYGYVVRWHPRFGETVEVSVSGCPTVNEAFEESFAAAKRLGYRRPTWRQVRRWITEIDYEKEKAACERSTELSETAADAADGGNGR